MASSTCSGQKRACRCSEDRPPASSKRPPRTGPGCAASLERNRLEAGFLQQQVELLALARVAQQRAEPTGLKTREAAAHIFRLTLGFLLTARCGVGRSQYYVGWLVGAVAVKRLLQHTHA